MKKYLIVFVAICATNLSASAQLTVSSSGNVTMPQHVAIGDATPNDTTGLEVLLSSPVGGRDYGIFATNSHAFTSSAFSGCHVGVFGKVCMSAQIVPPGPINFPRGETVLSAFKAGVVGMATSGYAIYGTSSGTLPNSCSDTYAGYFNGNVRASGAVTAAYFHTSSDMRLKNNITDLNVPVLQILSSLQPVSYNFIKDSLIYLENGDEDRLHYGLVAQEVQEILPNIVHEDAAGYLSVNYIELIPLLIQAINQQQAQIEELQDALDVANQNDSRRNVRANATSVPKLYQNSPNPFNKITTIGYDLPLDTHEASIHIYDLNGTEFVAFPIDTFGRSELTIDGGTLHAGMYLYSLIADGMLVDTKQMILTK